MTLRNPYVIGVPLTEGVAFYGREEFFTFIKQVLEAGKQNVIVLYGQRRIGKTSVLHRAVKWLEDQGGFFPVYYDLQGKERLNLGEVLANLAQTLARRLDLARPDPLLFDASGRYLADRFLPLAFQRLGATRLVLLLDEFDVLGDELATPQAASETLFPYIQDLIVSQPQMGFVFVVGRRIEELATHFQAIFKQAVYRRVGHLKPDDSRALIVEPARGMVSYSDEAVIEIQGLAAGHPYFTQLICFEAFSAAVSSGTTSVTRDTVRGAVERAIESGHGALNWFWEGLPRAERFILSAVAHVSDEFGVGSKDAIRQLLEKHRILLSGLELKDAPDRLVEWEMLRREGPDAYQFVVEIVRRWVLKEHPPSSARRDIDHVSKRALRLFENAREAHSEGDLAYARDEYSRALKANPNHSGAQLGLALVLYELGDIEEAIVEFERAYAIDQMSARDGLITARLFRARSLEEQNQADNAILEYEQVLRLASTQETAVRRLGSIWQGRGDAALTTKDLDATRNAFREALKHDQRKELATSIQSALSTHAEESAAAGDVEHGAATCALMLELLPEEARAQAAAFWFRCGDSMEGSGQLDDAIRFYTNVLAVIPEDAVAAERLASARRKQSERQAVDLVFDQALVAHRAGQMDAARDGWKRLIQMDVLSYKGNNIAALLSEAVGGRPTAAPAPAKRPQPQREAPSPPRTERAAGEQQQREENARPRTEPRWRGFSGFDAGSSERPPKGAGLVGHFDRWALSIASATVACLLAALLLSRCSASLVGIELPVAVEVKAGKTSSFSPTLLYSNDWGRRESPAARDYGWTSSDDAIVTVSNGLLTGISPGSVAVTATYGGFQRSTRVTVLPWDIPPLRANAVNVRFLAGGVERPQSTEYASRFDAKTAPESIWAQLVVELATGERAPETVLSYRVSSSDGTTVLTRDPWTITLPSDWAETTAVYSTSLGKRSALSAGTYRIHFQYEEKAFATAEFVVE